MIYSSEKDFVFVHTPKTGGVSVESALLKRTDWKCRTPRHHWKGLPGRHLSLAMALRTGWLPERPSLVFAMVRDPVEWYVSAWRWLRQVDVRRTKRGSDLDGLLSRFDWHPKQPLLKHVGLSFVDFVREVCTTCPGFFTDVCRIYSEGCDYVGRTETLQRDMDALFGPGQVVLERKNKSRYPRPAIRTGAVELIMESESEVYDRYYAPSTLQNRWAEDWKTGDRK